ncbi:hypothetical protein GCM10025859_34480 [Alicyclobacillus fastidiosus]|nr:hypothetical protein GCM10025859_34480 [Alicyclobacillus fastidiosus]
MPEGALVLSNVVVLKGVELSQLIIDKGDYDARKSDLLFARKGANVEEGLGLVNT